jgi:2-polyprenyl-3-methyl-5-hydroxy-6-metoxy-1,4-benzoquinol methylase
MDTATKPDFSKYSVHYRDMDPATADRARESLRRRIEDYRLRLDIEKILPWIKGPDVLDFPIGTGRFYPNLLARYNVYGYDISGEYIRRAKAQNPQIADHFAENSFEEVDRSRAFDTIATLRTLFNVKDTERAVRNAFAILKPGGRWIFNYPPIGDTYPKLRGILEANGFKVLKQEPYDFHYGYSHFSRAGQKLHGYLLALIERGFVPYFAFRTLEFLFGKHGTVLFVCEKTK